MTSVPGYESVNQPLCVRDLFFWKTPQRDLVVENLLLSPSPLGRQNRDLSRNFDLALSCSGTLARSNSARQWATSSILFVGQFGRRGSRIHFAHPKGRMGFDGSVVVLSQGWVGSSSRTDVAQGGAGGWARFQEDCKSSNREWEGGAPMGTSRRK